MTNIYIPTTPAEHLGELIESWPWDDEHDDDGCLLPVDINGGDLVDWISCRVEAYRDSINEAGNPELSTEEQALVLLRQARTILAHSYFKHPRAMAAIRRAIKSTEGAKRHAECRLTSVNGARQ